MEALLPVLRGYPLPSVLVIALLFRVVDQFLQKLPVPKLVQQDKFHAWRWRNLSVSMVHSLLTGTWAVTCAVVWPETLQDLHLYHTPLSYLLVCVSTGYFIQDAFDIICSGYARGSWEFLLHHALVLSCFIYSLLTHMYVAGAVVALFVEVNSVTLHLRLLLKLAGAQATALYHINKVTNIITYVIFRLFTQFYLTWGRVHFPKLLFPPLPSSSLLSLLFLLFPSSPSSSPPHRTRSVPGKAVCSCCSTKRVSKLRASSVV
uniref:TLC domain-containing protein n=1 Tax=Knipowitschia caucasica TaxID=637954 RepID=A0AAV2J3B5_KNICA